MLIELTNQRAVGLLQELEELQIIKVLKANITKAKKQKLSDKYRGIMSVEKGQELQQHIQNMRSEWNTI